MKLNSLLEHRSEHKGLSHTIRSARVCVRYDQVIAESFAHLGTTEAVKIERGRLTVTATSPTHASFLRLHEEDILTQLNSQLPEGADLVERLVFDMRS